MISQGRVDRLLSLGRELGHGGGVQLHIRKNWEAWEKKKFPRPMLVPSILNLWALYKAALVIWYRRSRGWLVLGALSGL